MLIVADLHCNAELVESAVVSIPGHSLMLGFLSCYMHTDISVSSMKTVTTKTEYIQTFSPRMCVDHFYIMKSVRNTKCTQLSIFATVHLLVKVQKIYRLQLSIVCTHNFTCMIHFNAGRV